MKEKDIKSIVKEKYGRIALQPEPGGCCGPVSDCCGVDYTIFSENYDNQQGYNKEADLGLGCGIPTEFAGIKPGHHVLDLGSGAGNDCFVARAIVGDSGQVTGLDFSDEMLSKARQNAEKLGCKNVEFVAGDIEEIPMESNRFDVVISNCVLNLVPHKQKAFAEIMRVLKPGGHFCVSDVVLKGELPDKLREDAEMYAGCVSGAMQMEDYLETITDAGFRDIQIHKQRSIEIPAEILKMYLNEVEMHDFRNNKIGLFSITVSAYKQV
ncbi:MAG: arsenite methyltransferase [Bacteroidales bacterium]|nr:arsenite methyltransferase [Bacteroidales bacterium]